MLDLAVVNRHSNDLSILIGLGRGRYAAPQQFLISGGPIAIAIEDLDAFLTRCPSTVQPACAVLPWAASSRVPKGMNTSTTLPK